MNRIPYLLNIGLEEVRMMYTMGGKECTLMVRKVDKRRRIDDGKALVVIREGVEVTGKRYQ
jgi:hypothetical protein